MSSEVRQIANAANAQLSTGPRTDQGKARSSQNARTHGLTASQLFIPAEERSEFDELHATLLADIRPEGALQETLFEQVIAAEWNLRRIRRMEAQLNASAPSLDSLDDSVLTKKLDRLARHRTSNERSYHRALRELKSLQTDARAPPAPGIHPANSAASLENENYKTNPSFGPGRPSKRSGNRVVVRRRRRSRRFTLRS
jgi:hypothetical protein